MEHAVGQGTGVRLRAPATNPWMPLAYLSLYRLVLALLFAMLALMQFTPRPLGTFHPEVFTTASFIYLAFAVLCALAVQRRRPAFELQLLISTGVDVVALCVLMYASGGVQSGLGMLVLVAVAGGSVLSRRRIAFLFASLASLAVLIQQIVLAWDWWVPVSDYTHGGLLGLGFFTTAALAHLSAQRIRASETLVQQHAVDLASLAELNEHIVQRMQSGVLVIDRHGDIPLINHAASTLLALPGETPPGGIAESLPAMAELLARWRRDSDRSSYVMSSPATGGELVVSFAALGARANAGVVVFLEDAAAMNQRAQQLKLASLGRLTAGIAHEVRNPLGAISHAGELLGENPALPRSERRLTEIINTNAKRVNEIIENVMQLSRRQATSPERMELSEWLAEFVKDFSAETGAREVLDTALDPPSIGVRCDPGQLRQVVWNLCENGLRHCRDPARVVLRAGLHADTSRPYLEIADNGPGISAEHAQHIFEPFFTTHAEGSGLGLYIARELCLSNQASLVFVPADDGACFRINFADPRRNTDQTLL
ncbi:MAG: ATP-binding protein [Pseudomonadota bacterium]